MPWVFLFTIILQLYMHAGLSACIAHLNMTSCVGVNAAIYISSACESSFKRSAFAFARCKKLCIWRHLLLLSAVIHESHSPIPPDWHHYTLLWITQPLLNRIIQNLLLKLSHINLCKLKIVIQIITAISW